MRRNCFSIIRLSQTTGNKPYIYYDVTPDGESNKSNCVTRALTLASGLPYYEVRKLLMQNAEYNDCEELCVCCYNALIEDYFGYKPVYVPYGVTVKEFAEAHRKGVYLVRMDGHISVVMQGKSVDIFDCTKEVVTHCWKVK